MIMMGIQVQENIDFFWNSIREAGIKPEDGLGTDLFNFVSALTPIINVDLFITDDKNRLLLSWRDDKYCGKGWHIPGGCLRFKEKLDDRISKTAFSEIGTNVVYDSHPMEVSENIANDYRTVVENRNIRAHFISILYKCKVDNMNQIKNCDGEHVVGHLKWFDHLPEDFIDIQYYYIPVIEKWFEEKSELKNV